MNSFFASSLITPHLGANGGRGRSQRIWSRLHGSTKSSDGTGIPQGTSEDFDSFGTIAPSASGTKTGVLGGTGYYVDTTTTPASITQLVDEGGVIQLSTGAKNNNEASIAGGADIGSIGQIKAIGSNPTGFEARVRFSSVAKIGAAIGLFKPGMAATGTLGTTGEIADTDFIGFLLENDSLKFAYKATGETMEVLADWDLTIKADEWYKLGFILRPLEDDDMLGVCVNNELVGYINHALVAADEFPTDVPLLGGIALKAYSATSVALDVDWIDAGQSA